MINFFRRIRRGLLDNGNLKRYSLYAVGEILLVMIGILLALQVNNWNNKKADQEAEHQVYQTIERQIADDKNVIIGVVNYNNGYLTQFAYANQLIDQNDRSKLDTLAAIIVDLTKNSDFNRSSNVYQNLVNSGKIQLIQNQVIIEHLQRLEETYIYMNRLEETQFQVIIQFVGPELMTKLDLSKGTINAVDNVFSFEFQNLIITIMKMMNEKNEIYQRALDEIDAITALIDEELD